MSKTIWYAAVNTMTAVQGDSIGTVISCHRSREAAVEAIRWAQPRKTESGAYLPCTVVTLSTRLERGRHVSPLSVIEA